MSDFMNFLDEAAHEREYNSLDVFPDIVSRAQAKRRDLEMNDPMLMANLTHNRHQQDGICLCKIPERVKKKEPMWIGLLWGIALGSVSTALMLFKLLA